jgi:poly(3-hydroxybutyrate) depolymerase
MSASPSPQSPAPVAARAGNPFAGIESPFFWPVGIALSLESQAFASAEKGMKFLREVVQTEIMRPKPGWATANRIVTELHTMTLRDFSAPTARDEIPTFILPPYAGHTSIIADFLPGQSLIETLLASGLTRVFAADWRSADPTMRDYDIDNYLSDLHVAITDLTGGGYGQVNLVGLCQGGWMAALYTARFPSQIASLTCAGSPIDTQAGNGDVRQLANKLPMSFYEGLVEAGGGLMRGEFMLEGFKNMHPEQHMVDKYVNLYLNIDDEAYVRRNENFERWYEYTINLPGRWYLQAVRQLFKDNLFARGDFVALGRNVKPQMITCPLYLMAGEKDDITPPPQVFNAADLFDTPADKIVRELIPGGHIGLFMGTVALRDYWPKVAAWLQRQTRRA